MSGTCTALTGEENTHRGRLVLSLLPPPLWFSLLSKTVATWVPVGWSLVKTPQNQDREPEVWHSGQAAGPGGVGCSCRGFHNTEQVLLDPQPSLLCAQALLTRKAAFAKHKHLLRNSTGTAAPLLTYLHHKLKAAGQGSSTKEMSGAIQTAQA